MDLNHILIFIALLSPLALIIRSQRTAALNRKLRNAAFAILIVTGVSWLVLPHQAGFIGGGTWFVLLLIPAVGSHKLADLTLRERFAAARRLAKFLSFIHPSPAFRDQATLFRALEIGRRGDTPRALQMLQSLQSGATTVASQAIGQSFRLRGDWESFQAWCRASFTPMALQRTRIAPLYFRALGETHRVDDLILQVAGLRRDEVPLAPGHAEARPSVAVSDSLPQQLSMLVLWSFLGRKALLVRLFETSLRKFDPEGKAFWLATAELAAGNIDVGREQLKRLHRQTSDAILQSEIVARLEHADEYARAAASQSVESNRILQRLETRPMRQMPYFASRGRGTPTVMTLIVLNVAMFLLEVIAGGSTNPFVLHRLGQLETFDFFASGEYWRLLSSLFLHYGPIHLLFNIYALYVLGPALEESIGAVRFIACYLISGIGSGLGVVLLHILGLTPAEEVVGASGCIMGIVGAWAGFLLRYRHLPLARRRLQNIVFIVVIQTVFDLSTPQVSMAAHMCGLITGLVVGLILAPRDLRPM
jgi:membrane associated rhomboid family serine protease